MPIELLFGQYKLTCDLFAEKDLRAILEPSELSQKPDLSYEIPIKIEDNHQFQFFFANSKKMYAYIEFYKEKCFQIDVASIEQEKKKMEREGNHNLEKGQKISRQTPVSFSFVLMGDEKSPTIPLKGFKRLLSRESRLESIITENLRTIENLRVQLNQSQAQNAKLKERIQVLQFEKDQLIQEKQSQKESEKPKKKIHTEQKEDGNFQQKTQQPKLIHQENPYKQHIYEGFDDLSFNENPNMNEGSLDNPMKNSNNSRNDKNHSSNFVSSQDSSDEGSRQRPPQSEKDHHQSSYHPEDKEPNSRINQYNKSKPVPNSIQVNQSKLSGSFDSDDNNHNNSLNEKSNTFIRPVPVNNHKQKLKESDLAKMIADFVGTCLVDVGFNERGQPKSGFVCVFCEKIFKESQFLRKHVLSRHPEILESHANESFLIAKLNDYKKNREAQLHAQMRLKKMEKMLKNNN